MRGGSLELGWPAAYCAGPEAVDAFDGAQADLLVALRRKRTKDSVGEQTGAICGDGVVKLFESARSC